MTIYKKNIAFTRTPFTGEYQHGDYFKIYPFRSKKGPANPTASHFPCIVELTYEEREIKDVKPFDLKNVDKIISETATQTNKLIEITNLLSCITNYRFFFYRDIETSWSLPLNEQTKKSSDTVKSEWSAPLFYYPELADEFKMGNAFSKPAFANIKLVDPKRYYFYDPVESTEKEIDFPNDIDDVITNYRGLNTEDKIVCDSAIFLFSNGSDLRDKMKSLSFMSVVSSIETLVHHEFKAEKIEYECNDCKTLKSSSRVCAKCGRSVWGIAAKFREFLFKYVSSQEGARKFYNKIYDIRSKIAHTDYLINGENFLNWDFSNQTDEIVMNHLEAIQLSRRAISNWIRSKKSK
jgi:hypothetical protein